MTYLIIALISVLIILNIILLIVIISNKNNNNENNNLKLYLKDEYNNLKIDLLKLTKEANTNNTETIIKFQEAIIKNLDNQLKNIDEKVERNIGSGFKQTQQTFINIVERLTKIDEAQKQIEKLSTDVISLNQILSDKQARGTFGEIQLHNLLYNVLGNNKKLYEEQIKLSNGKIADCIIYAPKPLGNIVIDSKFPLNSYQKMFDANLSEGDRKTATKQFKDDIKRHIYDIKTKYIIDNETADQAIMFIPAEAVFSEIVSKHPDIVEESNKARVWLVSPTTLISTLTIIQTIVKNIQRDHQAQLIVDELKDLAIEFNRYLERWSRLEKTAERLTTDIKDVNITSEKISKRFKTIEEGKFDQLKEGNENDI